MLSLSRVRRLNAAELTWRARELGDVIRGRVATVLRTPEWRRRDLAGALARTQELSRARSHLLAGTWHDAHRALADYLQQQPARFLIAPQWRDRVATDVTRRFPDAPTQARARGDKILSGRYDLLGYRGLAFDGTDWHHDPVHHKTAPLAYWSSVPYLSEQCGDHKIIWEFNRHQHWLELGRAYWLTGDARYRAECLRQLDSWMAVNPPLMGVNWASALELAFRAISWLWALNFFLEGASDDDRPWLVDLLLGVDRQLTHVERHLSYYFSPNTHLLGEALGLYVGGRCLPFLRASARREAVGRRVLLNEIGRQIAADGGHCERSPHYHRYTLDFYLLALAIARVTDDPAAGLFERACARLAHTARLLADDEGKLPLIGDDDGGSLFPITRRPPDDVRDSLAIAAALTAHTDVRVDDPPEELWWVVAHERFAEHRQRVERSPRPVPLASAALPSTGYYISRNEFGDHMVIDGGPHGYLNGGHAHADALSLTFTHRRRPLLIDPGTGVYTVDLELRNRFRSSVLHNTMTLNGRSQSVPRGPFHWRHTADADTRRWRTSRHFDYFSGTHDGYAPLTHFRQVLMLHDDLLVVADCAACTRELRHSAPHMAQAQVHWHVHPSWDAAVSGTHARLVPRATGAEPNPDDVVDLFVTGGRLERFVGEEGGLGWHAPVYGRIEPATTLRVDVEAPVPLWVVSVFGLDPGNRITAMRLAPLDTARDVPFCGVAIEIAREHCVDRMVVAEPVDDRRHLQWRAAYLDADARMAFTREVDGELRVLALVDGSTVRSERYPSAQRSFPSRTHDVYLDLSLESERRKAS